MVFRGFRYHAGLDCLGNPVFLSARFLRGLMARHRTPKLDSRTSGFGGTQRALAGWVVSVVVALGLGYSPAAVAKPPVAQTPELASVALAALPPEAKHTYRLIHAGGPFPYAKDGTIFGNREKILPRRPRGQYREYTVKTPGLKNRGARRIVCDGLPPDRPTDCFYTDDHYSSFRRIGQ